MAEKSAKKKTKKTAKASSDPSVLGNLRSSSPTRIGGERHPRGGSGKESQGIHVQAARDRNGRHHPARRRTDERKER